MHALHVVWRRRRLAAAEHNGEAGWHRSGLRLDGVVEAALLERPRGGREERFAQRSFRDRRELTSERRQRHTVRPEVGSRGGSWAERKGRGLARGGSPPRAQRCQVVVSARRGDRCVKNDLATRVPLPSRAHTAACRTGRTMRPHCALHTQMREFK